MVMQFLQLCPWKRHTGVLCVPPGWAKEPSDAMGHSHFPVGPDAGEGVGDRGMSVLGVAQSFPSVGSSRSGASAAVEGNRKQGWEGEVCRAEHRLGERSPVLCIANCFCRQAGCL